MLSTLLQVQHQNIEHLILHCHEGVNDEELKAHLKRFGKVIKVSIMLRVCVCVCVCVCIAMWIQYLCINGLLYYN